MKFKNKLREYRKKQKITQSELAEKSGVSRSTIIAIENEKAEVVKTDTLIKLAKALDAEMKAIFFTQCV
ncbi:helix-turn-helix transcriptional regulator [Dialister invisus]|uniref:Helix-turn-helix XRE-family like protein n=1 Tax=Siphoviridae sp. ctkyE7 TaxID=2827926 RepID=A0A8S5SRA0_9CAUD|nr:helix-turn-helix transcriptional regulator [Dialister invisus]DAF53339.1 MAG TPA: Helix-turn-helix XRE-family like protein [Siphoviridae sp. ctkyE7]DAJ78346.1 MAG TPA: Helix-turn-helix XRE-family like protein [Caudoviricetes sp.]